MILVALRNKNQSEALTFVLKNLTKRYSKDNADIIFINKSKEITVRLGASFVTIKNFSFKGSGNLCAKEAKNDNNVFQDFKLVRLFFLYLMAV